jgi:hypothetical protein
MLELKCNTYNHHQNYVTSSFIYSLLNDNFSTSDHIVSNETTIVTNELERMQKEVVVA